MDLHDTIRTYRLFSGSYDLVFGPVFHPGRKEAVRIANDRPGQRVRVEVVDGKKGLEADRITLI